MVAEVRKVTTKVGNEGISLELQHLSPMGQPGCHGEGPTTVIQVDPHTSGPLEPCARYPEVGLTHLSRVGQDEW